MAHTQLYQTGVFIHPQYLGGSGSLIARPLSPPPVAWAHMRLEGLGYDTDCNVEYNLEQWEETEEQRRLCV